MQNILNIIEKYKTKGPKFHLIKLEEDLNLHLGELPKISACKFEDLYLLSNELTEIPKCPVCANSKKFINYKKGWQNTCHTKQCINKYTQNQRETAFLNKYGVKNPKQIKEVQKKIEETNLKRYGHKNAASSEEIKNKIKNTFIKNYGVDNPMKNVNVVNKGKATLLDRYGVDNAYQLPKVLNKLKDTYGDNFGFGSEFFKNKSKETCQAKYGVDYHLQREDVHVEITKTMNDLYGGRGFGSNEIRNKMYDSIEKKFGNRHPMHNEEIKKKLKDTCLLRYGVNSPMQVTEIFDKQMKSAFNFKEVTMPSGNIVKVQGYEPFAIKTLLDTNYTEEDLVIGNTEIENHIGKIKYLKNDKLSRYYPDLYIPKESLIIEVKSEYTYQQNKKINELKKKACLSAGLTFKFMIFTSVKKDLIEYYWL